MSNKEKYDYYGTGMTAKDFAEAFSSKSAKSEAESREYVLSFYRSEKKSK